MKASPNAEPSHAELVVRLGSAPADCLAMEGARVTAIYHAMRGETNQWHSARYDCGLLDRWQRETCQRMNGQDTAGQLREVLRFERQLAALADGLYDEQQAELRRRRAEVDTARTRAAAPTVLLASLRAQGKALALDDKGRIVAPSGAGLHLTEVAAVKEHKAELVALLKAETEAAGPLVIA